MPGFFDALNKQPVKQKVHKVTIQGKTVEVSLEKKLEVQQHGEDAYVWKSASEFALKPQPRVGVDYRKLRKSEDGIVFYNNDPFYPKCKGKGGFVWRYDTE